MFAFTASDPSRTNAPLSTYSPSDFHGHPTQVIHFGVPPHRIDLLQSVAGLEAEDIWAQRVELTVDPELKASFISLQHLIRNKQAVGRPGDVADVEQLKKVKNEN